MKIRVLVFEDDALLRRILKRALERAGCEVHVFAEPGLCPLFGASPCSCQSRVCADAIISDLNMPGMSGLELVERRRHGPCAVRRYLLASGNWTALQLKRALELGCEVVQKPFDFAFIIDWVNRCRTTSDRDRELIEWVANELPDS